MRAGRCRMGCCALTPSTAEAGERLIPKQHAFTHAPVPPRKEETRVSSPASEAREGDPWRCAREWIPFPSARLRPGMTLSFITHPLTSSPGLSRGSRCERRRACPYRDGRHEAGHDSGSVTRGRREGASGGAPATLCSHFVLDNSPNLSYTLAQDLLLTRGALARRRSVGAGTVPCMSRTQVRVTGGPGCVPLNRDWVQAPLTLRFPPGAVTEPASPVRLKKPCAKRPPGSSITHMHQRAGLPVAPPSISPQARSPNAPGPQVLAV